MKKPLLSRLIKVLGGRSPGFTLIELVIVVALAGIVSVAIMATTFQVFSFSALASNQMTAIRQVQQAGFWVSPDVMMAKEVGLTETEISHFPVTLTWQAGDPNAPVEHEAIYRLEDMGNGLKRLVREHHITPPGGPETIDTMVVAQYIYTDFIEINGVNQPATCFAQDGDAFKLTVTAKTGEQTETRTYQVKQRVTTAP
jgi:prepilin-type N-terminal cleavage/methylation domain-containing protein